MKPRQSLHSHHALCNTSLPRPSARAGLSRSPLSRHLRHQTRFPLIARTLLSFADDVLGQHTVHDLAALLPRFHHRQAAREDCRRTTNFLYLSPQVILLYLDRQTCPLSSPARARDRVHVYTVLVCALDDDTLSVLVQESRGKRDFLAVVVCLVRVRGRKVLYRILWPTLPGRTGVAKEGHRKVAVLTRRAQTSITTCRAEII